MSKRGNPYHDLKGRFTDQLTHKVAETRRKSKKLFDSILEQKEVNYPEVLNRLEKLDKRVNGSGSGWWAFNPENPHVPKNPDGSISLDVNDIKTSEGSFDRKKIQSARIAIAKSKIFDKTEAEGMKDYCLADYKMINWCLRDGASVQDSGGSAINSALKFSSKKEFTVYRGLSNDLVANSFSKMKKGDVTSDSAFLSTSTDKRVAESFSKNGVLLELNVKPNTRFGIPLLTASSQSPSTRAGSDLESEIIFKPGQKIEIKEVSTRKTGEIYVRADIIP